MKVKAKITGVLNKPVWGLKWLHKKGEVKDFSDKLAKKILATSNNYEKASAKQEKPSAEHKLASSAKELDKKVGVKK